MFTRVFSPQLIRNVRSRRRIDSSSIIAHPVNLRWERSLMPRTRYIYVYDALDNRYGFSISVQPEIDCTTFHCFFSWNVWKKIFFKIFKSWQVCDWLAKWIILLGFMDLRWPRVFRRFSVGLVKLGKDIYYPKISDEFDHGGSALLNMRIMDHLMHRPLLAFLDSFFKLKSPNLVQR